MHNAIDVTIEPSEKYRRTIDFYDDPSETDSHYEEWPEEHKEAADGYIETIDTAPTAEDFGEDIEDLPTLSWDDFSVASDPDVVAKIATYFDGMDPDEPTDRLRAKLRLLDCEVYANAQIAAQAELRA